VAGARSPGDRAERHSADVRGDQRGCRKVFPSNSAGLIAFASVYAIWQASGSIRAAASYTSAAANLLLLMVVVTYFYVSSVVFLIGAQLDEFLRQDAKGREVVGIHDLARRVFQ